MGVRVRERKPGGWWLFIGHKGRRKAKKIGSKEDAEIAKIKLEEELKTGPLNIRTRADNIRSFVP